MNTKCECVKCRVSAAIFGARTSIGEEDLFHELSGVAELLGANLASLSTEHALAVFQKIAAARNMHMIASTIADVAPTLHTMEVQGNG